MKRAVHAALLASLVLSGCGPKAIAVGSRPFPSEKKVFTDVSGNALADLPGPKDATRLLLLDFPWCPPCREAWGAVRDALGTVPPGSVRVYRILFDREMLVSAAGRRDTAPLHPPPPPWPESAAGGAKTEVTTLTALPDAFREEFQLRQAPVLLLIEPDGKVARRWNGYSTELRDELSSELRKRSPVPSALPPGK